MVFMSDADTWEMQCRKMAGELGVDIVIERVAVKSEPSIEAQARAVRYDIFQKYLTENTLLLLAHHLDDQVETVLFRLIRGAGSAGLSGIPKTRQVGAGSLLRPFLGIHRSEIEAYASELGLKSISDPSNDDLALDRNFLRHQVLPMIEARWPGYRSGISRTAQIMGSVDDASTDAWYQCPFGCPSLDVDFREAETLHASVHAKLKAMGLDLPAFDALKELSRQCLNAGRDKTPTLYTDAYALSCWRGRLQILPATIAPCEPEETVVGRAISRAWGSLTWVAAKTGLAEGSQVSLRPIDEGSESDFPEDRVGLSAMACKKWVSRLIGVPACQRYASMRTWWRSPV
jgi:tRNA(Ile)-lysidine synthase